MDMFSSVNGTFRRFEKERRLVWRIASSQNDRSDISKSKREIVRESSTKQISGKTFDSGAKSPRLENLFDVVEYRVQTMGLRKS
jgi:hypothetical protein